MPLAVRANPAAKIVVTRLLPLEQAAVMAAQTVSTLVIRTVPIALRANFDNKAIVVLPAEIVRQVSIPMTVQLGVPIVGLASMRKKKERPSAQDFRAQMARVRTAPKRAGSTLMVSHAQTAH